MAKQVRRSGQIIARGDRTWLVRMYVGRDGDGRRRYHSLTIRGTKADASRALTALLREKDLGALVPTTRMTLGAWLDAWLARRKPEIGPRTYAGYVAVLNLHVRPALGATRLPKLAPADVQRFINALTARGMGATAVRLVIAPLRAALREAVRQGLLVRSPFDAGRVAMPRVGRVERTVLAPEQAAKLLATCEEDEAWGPLITVLLLTDCRPGELLALCWTDLEADGDTLRVQRALVRIGSKRIGSSWTLAAPKTKRSRRAIVLSARELRAIDRQRKRQAAERLAAGPDWQDHGLIFATSLGTPHDAGNISRRVLPRLLERAKLPRMRLYDLRHSCATLLLAGGENVKVVSERLGHASVALTLDTYSHVLPGQQRQATDTLARILAAARPANG